MFISSTGPKAKTKTLGAGDGISQWAPGANVFCFHDLFLDISLFSIFAHDDFCSCALPASLSTGQAGRQALLCC